MKRLGTCQRCNSTSVLSMTLGFRWCLGPLPDGRKFETKKDVEVGAEVDGRGGWGGGGWPWW